MEMEFYYVVMSFNSSDMGYKELMRVINNYISSDPDEQNWNYAGKSIIDMYLNNKVMDYNQKLKVGKRSQFKTILNFLKEYIGIWKKTQIQLKIIYKIFIQFIVKTMAYQ